MMAELLVSPSPLKLLSIDVMMFSVWSPVIIFFLMYSSLTKETLNLYQQHGAQLSYLSVLLFEEGQTQ